MLILTLHEDLYCKRRLTDVAVGWRVGYRPFTAKVQDRSQATYVGNWTDELSK